MKETTLKTEPRIVINRIQTPDGTILTSYHTHDFAKHVDKNGETYFTDGGNEYLRRSINKQPYIDLSIYSDAPFQTLRENVCRGGRGKDGTQPLTWVPINKMSNAWLEACIQYNIDRGIENGFHTNLYRKELEYRKENNIFIED